MSVDRALLDLAAEQGTVFLRMYRWDPHCLSFGCHEPALRRYDRDAITAMGLECVRRPTGGRAVWHARELTYAVAAPASFGTLPDAYQTIHRMLAEAVRALGADARLAGSPGRTPGPGDGPCFAAPVGGEVLVTGRKVVGSAQLRGEGGLLQHGSLLLEDDQDLVYQLSGGVPSGAEAPLSTLLGRPVGFDEAASAVTTAAAAWSRTWLEVDESLILARAEPWYRQFRSDQWTWVR